MKPKIHQCQCAVCKIDFDRDAIEYHHDLNLFLSRLNEAQRRWYVGLLSREPNGLSDRELSRITGLDAKTIRRGRREFENDFSDFPLGRQRRPGGGRHRSEKKIHS